MQYGTFTEENTHTKSYEAYVSSRYGGSGSGQESLHKKEENQKNNDF